MYAAAREGAAAAVLEERGVLAVRGPDRQKFLNNILSNDVGSLRPGEGCLAALMDVKGRLVALTRVLVAADAVFVEVDGGRLERVEAALAHYRVAAPVRFTKLDSSVVALVGPKAAGLLQALGGPDLAPGAGSHAEGHLAEHPVRVARAPDFPASGLALHVARDAQAAVLGALWAGGARPLDRATLDVLRIEDGKPWYGSDVTDENLLHETGLVGSHHSPTKGCYVGQEVVARLEGRGGHVNKHLRGLRLGGIAANGDAVMAEGKEVGRITTAGSSPRFGSVALAYVHRSHADPGTSVEVGERAARVVDLPFED